MTGTVFRFLHERLSVTVGDAGMDDADLGRVGHRVPEKGYCGLRHTCPEKEIECVENNINRTGLG